MRMTMGGLLALLGMTRSAGAAEVTVQPGDDLYSLTESLGAGDVIVFEDGVYELQGTLNWSGFAGTVDQPVELRAAPDAVPILRQMQQDSWNILSISESQNVIVRGLVLEGGPGWESLNFNGLSLDTVSDVTITDMEIRQVQHTGLRLSGDCNNVQIRGNQIHTLAEGEAIEVGCWDASCFVQNSVIANNWIHDLVGEGSDGINLLNGSQGNQILDNVIHDVGDDGVYLASTESGAPNVFEGNAVWNVFDVGLYIEGSSTIRNNVIAKVGGRGIQTNNGDRDDLDDVIISHNTIADTGSDAMYLEDVFFRSGIVVTNNVLANPTGLGLRYTDEWQDYDVTANVLRNNVVTGLVQNIPEAMLATAILPGGGLTDFSNPDALDYYPVGTAVLVNAGDPSADSWVPELDFNGLPREGDQPDAGAYEWDGDGNPGDPLTPGFKGTADAGSTGTHDVGGGCCSKDGDEGQAFLVMPLLALAGLRRRRAAA